ncbi:DMT superfamily transport protein [Halobacterium hubeiense]|uniref:DMT superfamily transport protein n=1 Tax=Halobacterium hubeiense TaxID=1407499 RepID=A0A0U5H592_9EURY|nr:DMT family transporter [Halobacterium hubeiense]CQH53075.1 DMT superfamily transport protein [Halobacterium hubeiense]
MGLRDAAAPLTAAGLWGGMYVVSKWGFAAVPPVTLAFLRIVVGAVALYAALRALGRSPSFSARDRRGFLRLGAWVALTLATQFVGTDRTTASQGSLLTMLTPVFTLLLGVTMLDERLTWRSTVGMALAGVGTALVVAGQYGLSIGGGNAVGVAVLFVASAAWAAYTVDGARLVRTHGALVAATYSSLAAVPMLGALAAVELAVTGATVPVTPGVVGAVAYLGVASTAAAWFLWYRGVERTTATVVAACFFAQPLVGGVLGALLLGEALGPGFAVGGVVMGVGVALVSTARTG